MPDRPLKQVCSRVAVDPRGIIRTNMKFHQNWTSRKVNARTHGRTHTLRTQDHDISATGLWPGVSNLKPHQKDTPLGQFHPFETDVVKDKLTDGQLDGQVHCLMPPTIWAHQTEVYNISFKTDVVKDKLTDGQLDGQVHC
ncbi:hypothetical protein DPMN_044033 [Dreissena polymorpha]|uniref:Uncharacterized protein n=1 Tax=Dreissena polymorpha TaxID=45954 RepID=A0A9D4HW50_DREPO|nr:hypothetical protein DPMN_044033 [Dreissena polymorpha]